MSSFSSSLSPPSSLVSNMSNMSSMVLKSLKPQRFQAHASFMGYARFSSDEDDAEKDEKQRQILKTKGGEYIVLRRLMLYDLVSNPSTVMTKRADIYTLLALVTDDAVLEDELAFQILARSIFNNKEFSEIHKSVAYCLRRAWFGLEIKLFRARMALFRDDKASRLLQSWCSSSVTVELTNVKEVRMDFVSEFARRLDELKSDAKAIVTRGVNWVNARDAISKKHDGSTPSKNWLVVKNLPLEARSWMLEFELSRYPHIDFDSDEWDPFKRLAVQIGDTLYGDFKTLSALLSGFFAKVILPRRSAGCECAVALVDGPVLKGQKLSECESCTKSIQESWFSKKKSVAISRGAVVNFVEWLKRTEHPSVHGELKAFDYLRLVGPKPVALMELDDEWLPPCIREMKKRNMNGLALDAFDAILRRERPKEENKARSAAYKEQMALTERNLFGAPQKAPWTCMEMCYSGICCVRNEMPADEFDLEYHKRCRLRMKDVARRHLKIELDDDDDKERKAMRRHLKTNGKFVVSAGIETPADFTLNLLLLANQL